MALLTTFSDTMVDAFVKMDDTVIYEMKVARFVISVIGAVLNSSLLIFLLKRRRFYKPFEIAYLNMNISDLIMSSYYVITFIDTTWFSNEKDVFCTLIPVLDGITSYVNLLALLPITVDRFVAFMCPTRYRNRRHVHTIIGIISGCWLVPIVYEIVRAIRVYVSKGVLSQYDREEKTCFYAQTTNKYSLLIWNTMTMVVPLIFSVICYTFILSYLRDKKSSSDVNPERRVPSTSYTNRCVILIKAILTSILFCMSWLPYFFVVHLIKRTNFYKEQVHAVSMFLYLNTITDPLFYLLPNSIILSCIKKTKNSLTE